MALTALPLALVLVRHAGATFPVTNGQIAFVKGDPFGVVPTASVFIANPDGSHSAASDAWRTDRIFHRRGQVSRRHGTVDQPYRSPRQHGSGLFEPGSALHLTGDDIHINDR